MLAKITGSHWIVLVLLLWQAVSGWAQPVSLSISSGSAVSGDTVALNLSLSADPTNQPASLQWTLTYSSTAVGAMSLAAGPALTSAGKTLTCVAGAASYSCVATGMTGGTIASGVVAVATMTALQAASMSIDNALGAGLDGTPLPILGTGGSITVTQPVVNTISGVSCPAAIDAGKSASCTVTLSAAAATGGASVALSSSNVNLQIPVSVSVAQGATSATFSVTAGSVSTDQSAVLTATLNAVSKAASLALAAPPVLFAFTCSPASLSGGGTATCTATLSKAAPAGGAVVGLSDNSTVLAAPASLTVPAGSSFANVMVSAGPVAMDQSAAITASFGGVSKTASIALTAPGQISALSCAPAMLAPSGAGTCTVSLTRAAGAAGAVVTLGSSNTALTVPASVTVGAGLASAMFTAAAAAFTADQTAIVTAGLSGALVTASIALSLPVQVAAMACSPSAMAPGGRSICDVGLNKPASAAGAVVVLSSNSTMVTVPATLTIAAGLNKASFTATAGTFTTDQTAGVTASYGGASRSFSYTLATTPVLSSFTCTPTTLTTGAAAACTVGLSKAAAASLTVLITASNTSSLRPPGWVVVATGASSAQFSVTAGTLAGWAVLTAKVGTLSKSVPFTVKAATALSAPKPMAAEAESTALSCNPRMAQAGSSVTCELRLAGAAEESSELPLFTTSRSVHVPETIHTRGGQASLTFEAFIDPDAASETLSILALAGDQVVDDSVTVLPLDAPVLRVPAKQWVKTGGTVEFTVTASDASGQPVALSVTDSPEGAVFDASRGRFTWTPAETQQGVYEPAFVATNAAQVSRSARVSIEAGSGQPVVSGVRNAASQSEERACSPGAVASLQGKWLSGARVLVNEESVPVLATAADQVQFLCPQAAAGATLAIAAETDQGRSASVTTTMWEAAPGIFSVDGSGARQGRILIAGSDDLAMPRNFRYASQPAQPGDSVVLLATGVGANAPALAVRVGDVPAEIEQVSPDPQWAGIYRIQVKVPAGAPVNDRVPVWLEVSGWSGETAKSNTVTMTIEAARP